MDAALEDAEGVIIHEVLSASAVAVDRAPQDRDRVRRGYPGQAPH